MLIILGILITLAALVIVPRLRVPGGREAPTIGWMSEQWLAEQRASHPS
jgi:hypothetical protein